MLSGPAQAGLATHEPHVRVRSKRLVCRWLNGRTIGMVVVFCPSVRL